MMLNYEYVDDPAYSLSEGHPEGYKALMFVLVLSYICLIVELVCQIWRIIKVWRSRLARHKTLVLFSLYFMIAFAVVISTGAAQYYQLSGAGLLSSMGIYNLYIMSLQWLYSFSGDGKQKEATFKEVENNYAANREFAYMDNLEEDPEEPPRNKATDFRMDVDDLDDGTQNADNGFPSGDPEKKFKVGGGWNDQNHGNAENLKDIPPWDRPKENLGGTEEQGLWKKRTIDENDMKFENFDAGKNVVAGAKFEFEDDEASSDGERK